jgi:hypothetical protein
MRSTLTEEDQLGGDVDEMDLEGGILDYASIK